MIRVLLVLDSLVPGGAERSTVAMLPGLLERGIYPEVVTLHDRPGLQADVQALDVPLYEIGSQQGRLSWIRRLHGVMRRSRPDLVHTTLFWSDVCGRVAATAARVPVVSSLATVNYGPVQLASPHLRRSSLRAHQMLDASTARLTTRLHAVSETVADEMASNLRYPRHRIDVVHRGRPAELLNPRPTGSVAQARSCLGISNERPTVLLVARHEPDKGIDRAIEAMPNVLRAVPDAVLVVAGMETRHSAGLVERIGELDLAASVHLLGHRTDVPDLLSLADAFLLPSRREGLPGALLEAMAAGVPIVANELPQVREVITTEQGHITEARDAARFADAIVDVLTDRAAATVRAERARDRFRQHFTLDRTNDAMAAFYRRSLGHDSTRLRSS